MSFNQRLLRRNDYITSRNDKKFMFKRTFGGKILVCCFLFFVFNSNLAVASPFSAGLDKTAGETGHIGASSSKIWTADTLPVAVGKMIGGLLALLGVIFLILMIYGGFIWMLARGSDEEVEKGKKIIGNAIGGLIIVLGAYAITVFVGSMLVSKV